MFKSLLSLSLLCLFVTACSSGGSGGHSPTVPGKPEETAPDTSPSRENCVDYYSTPVVFGEVKYRLQELGNAYTSYNQVERQVVNSAVLTEVFMTIVNPKLTFDSFDEKQQKRILDFYQSLFDSNDQLRQKPKHRLEGKC